MIYEHVPDFDELGERRAEHFVDGDKCICAACEKRIEFSEACMISPDPYGPPFCRECAEKEAR